VKLADCDHVTSQPTSALRQSFQFLPFCSCYDLDACDALAAHLLDDNMILRDLIKWEFVSSGNKRVLVADDDVDASVMRLGCLAMRT
jgi:hypothetical protein